MFSAINKNFELNQKNKILNFSFGFISLRVNNFFQFFYSVKNILKPKYLSNLLRKEFLEINFKYLCFSKIKSKRILKFSNFSKESVNKKCLQQKITRLMFFFFLLMISPTHKPYYGLGPFLSNLIKVRVER